MAGEPATGEDRCGLLLRKPQNNDGRWLRCRISAQPPEFTVPIGAGRPIGRTQHIDRAILAVVAVVIPRWACWSGGRESRMPATVFTIPFQPNSSRRSPFILSANPAMGRWIEAAELPRMYKLRQSARPLNENGLQRPSAQFRPAIKLSFACGRAHRQQHGICRCHVVASSFAKKEKRQRDQVHPGQHPVAAIAQIGNQAQQPERNCKKVRANRKLVSQESVGSAFTHVARMDVAEKIVGDEIMANKPNQVGKKDQQRQCNAAQNQPLRK